MKRKRNIITATVVMLVLALVMPTACARAEFELSSLEITPGKVGTGDTATVTVDVTNIGTAEGTYAATLTIDGVLVETENVTLPVGGSQKVTFTVMKEIVGVYTVEVGGLSGTLHVVKPAEFQLSSLTVTPQEVVLGDEATATVDVRNIGEVEGDYDCALLLDGVAVQREEVTVDGSTTKTVTLTFMPEQLGPCQVTVGDLTHTIKVLKPAEFRVSSLVVTPAEVLAGELVTITVDVKNVGEVAGTHNVTLKVNGEKTETKTVTLTGKATDSVSFTVVEDTIGIHNIKVNTMTGTLKVSPTPPAGYKGYADWENGVFITYPAEWEQLEGTYALVTFTGPEEGFTPTFNVEMETFDQEVTAKDRIEAAKETMKSFYPGYKTISTEEVSINNIPAVKHIFTWSMKCARKTTPVKMVQVALVRNKTNFAINCGSSLATYDKHADTFDEIIGSFRCFPLEAAVPAPSYKVMYADDFSNPLSGWPKEPETKWGKYELYYEDGEYHIQGKRSYLTVYAWLPEQFLDFTLEVDTRMVRGSSLSSYGLIFRVQDEDNFYRFLISPGYGDYRVETRVKEEWTTLQSRTKSAFIKEGYSTNHLKVVCKGYHIEVYANGHYLTTVTDNCFAKGGIGMVVEVAARAIAGPPMCVAFDNIRVYRRVYSLD